ncbi:hypothetical protein KSS87_018617, partial [Heliosperma pusillum]
MVFNRWLLGSIPRTVRFPYAALWVRVCGLPFEYLSMHVANIAGNLLSHDFLVDGFDEVPNNDFLRLKVCIKLNEPLMPGFFLTMDEGHLLWVQFKYEDIFKYCIRCGKICHQSVCCRESIMTIVSNVNVILDRTSERGFAVFQTQSNHTMFNLDLRAAPSTTRFVSSRVRTRGSLNSNTQNGVGEEEQIIDFDLGTTLGGRVYPGMRFTVTAQPFAGPVIFQVDNASRINYPSNSNMGGFLFNEGNIANRNFPNLNMNIINEDSMQVNSNEEFHSASEDSFQDMDGDMGFDAPGGDPYHDYSPIRRLVVSFDRDLNIQEGILNRIESDVEWARDDIIHNSDNDGFIINIEDTSGSSPSSPAQNHDISRSADTLPVWSGEENQSIYREETQAAQQDVNTLLELNLGGQPHSYDPASLLPAQEVAPSILSIPPSAITQKELQLQAGSSNLSSLVDHINMKMEGNITKEINAYSKDEKSDIDKLRGPSEGLMGQSLGVEKAPDLNLASISTPCNAEATNDIPSGGFPIFVDDLDSSCSEESPKPDDPLGVAEESDSEWVLDSLKHPVSSLPCFEQYAMKPFYGQHDSIIDLNLQDYIKHKIPLGSHTLVSRLLGLERHLIGEGSHRRLSSSIKFSVQQDLSPHFLSQMCEVIIIERLPSGVFADPFELDHILQRGVFKDAYVFGDTNLELPSFLSNQSVVEIHLDAALGASAEQEIVKEIKVEFPLHARYPPLEKSGYSTVKFDIPDLFLRCKSKTHVEEPVQTCLLTPIADSDGLKVHEIKWSIPAGMDAHAKTVSVVTFTVALISVILIVIASLKHARMDSDARSVRMTCSGGHAEGDQLLWSPILPVRCLKKGYCAMAVVDERRER